MKKKDYAQSRAALLVELDGLRVEVDEAKRIGYLWLDRPPLNIVSYRGRAQIRAIIEAFDEDDDVGVVVIRGANGVYTSGGDVKKFMELPPDAMSDLAFDIGAPERCGKPVIAALEKYGFGVGFELALACDFRLATKETQVGLPESSIGQMPGSGGSVRVARIVGMTRAKDMVMMSRRLGAEEAKSWGLITEIAADGAALTKMVDDYAAKLNSFAPISLRTLKRTLNTAYDSSLKAALDFEGFGYEKLRQTEDYKEGINAFGDKRKAIYRGR
ncbi:MAG: enoyl-CoA hydratase/isomerase family protein [Rhodospirillales bacterium]|nr:enoyl-CoA hydratase/isomerase family protein [Rhodospirillales bacterium]